MKEENKCLFMLKGISCIIVVLLHCPLPGKIGEGIIYALRFPVPIFFMISGYYSFFKQDYFTRAKKMLIFIVQAELIAGIISLICFCMGQDQYNPLMILAKTNWLKTLLFGSVFNGTLWYLYAMFWGWIVFCLISKINKGFELLYWSVIPLLVFHVLARIYITEYSDIEKYIFLFRSAVLFGVPFLGIGRFIAEYKKMVAEGSKRIRGEVLILTGMFLMVIEYLLWHRYMDFQVSTFFTSVGLVVFALQHPGWNPLIICSKIGKDISKYIYILHMPLKMAMDSLFISVGIHLSSGWILPILLIGITVAVSYVFFKLKKKILSVKKG